MEHIKIEIWNQYKEKNVYYDDREELTDSDEFSDWVDEEMEKLDKKYKIDPELYEYAVEHFIKNCWELVGNGVTDWDNNNIVYPNLKSSHEHCWDTFADDFGLKEDRIYIKSAHSSTSEEEIAKAIVICESDFEPNAPLVVDGTTFEFSDMNYVISVHISDPYGCKKRYTISDANPQEKCSCDEDCDDDCECYCHDDDYSGLYWDFSMTMEEMENILEPYYIVWD